MVSRRFFVSGLLSGLAGAGWAEPLARSPFPAPRPEGLAKRAAPGIDTLIARTGLSGKVGFVVADAKTGAVLEAHNPVLKLPPASTTKAITAMYGLKTLGSGYRFVTRVLATGPVQAGIVQGDLVLQGSGDPALDTDQLADLAARLRAAGVRGVSGKFIYDDRALPHLKSIDPGQPEHVGYNPAISGLNLNFNRVHFEWKPASSGWAVTMDARAKRYRPQVQVARMKVVNRQVPIYTYADAKGADQWTVASGALGKGGSRWLPVRRPGEYAAEVFQTLARAQGISLPRAQRAKTAQSGTELARHQSAPLSDILRGMLKYSTNLTAEVVGMSASRRRGGTGASLSASAGQMEDWLKATLGPRHAKFVDHSGLGDGSRISANEMNRALLAAAPDGALKGLMKDVPMRDAKGKVVKGSPIKIKAKTGTLNFVSSLAGYVTTPKGRELTFAIFTADTSKRAQLSRSERERPEGGRSWARRSRGLQAQLVDRWATVYEL
nr:D-alanyl-D-alanine carboxypeptidase/D-alanyl-D-alanine-endopeptidase [Actibacterium atlanticum]